MRRQVERFAFWQPSVLGYLHWHPEWSLAPVVALIVLAPVLAVVGQFVVPYSIYTLF